jgi:hypothetical protein
MTIQETAKVLTFLSGCYPNVNITDAMPAVWAEMFAEWPVGRVMAAAKEAAETCTFFPNVADIHQCDVSIRQRQAAPYQALPSGSERPPLGPDQYYAYDGTVITAHQETDEERAARKDLYKWLIKRMPGSRVPTPITAKDGMPF